MLRGDAPRDGSHAQREGGITGTVRPIPLYVCYGSRDFRQFLQAQMSTSIARKNSEGRLEQEAAIEQIDTLITALWTPQ